MIYDDDDDDDDDEDEDEDEDEDDDDDDDDDEDEDDDDDDDDEDEDDEDDDDDDDDDGGHATSATEEGATTCDRSALTIIDIFYWDLVSFPCHDGRGPKSAGSSGATRGFGVPQRPAAGDLGLGLCQVGMYI